jgi:hypothetical protein
MGAKSDEMAAIHGVNGELTSRALKALLKHHKSSSTDDATKDG